MANNIHTTTVVDANAWDQLMQMDAPANSPVATTVAGVAPIQTWSEMEQVLPDIGDVDNKILAAAGFSNTILISTTTAEVLETITVSIGENGNWFVGTEDTGVPAVGTDATTMPKASGLYTAAALTQAGTLVTLVAGTEYCVKVGASYGSFVVLADTLITLSADTMILTIDNAGAIRQYPLGTNANIIPPSEALVGIAMSGSGGTAKFEAPTVHQAWIVASLAKPFSELAQQAAINANLSAVNAQEAADSAAQSEIIVSQNVSIAQEWAESPEDDPISTSPFSFSALHWAMKAQAFAQVAGSGLVWYGGWDASGNLAPPTPAAGSGAPFYRITGAGTIGTVAYAIGDYIHWDTIGLVWFKIDGTDSVVSVNGRGGAVILTGADVGISVFGQTLVDDVDAATARTTLGAQPLDATLTAMAGVVTAADKFIYFDGVDTAKSTTLTAFARTLLDDVDASTARTTLGAYNVDGGPITTSNWTAGNGGRRYNGTFELGTTLDLKYSLVILAPKYVGTILDKAGFLGTVIFDRGSAGAIDITEYVDVDIAVAYNSNKVRLMQRSGTPTNTKIVEVQHNGATHYAIWRAATSAVYVTAMGTSYSPDLPVLVPDASGIATTDLNLREVLYGLHNILGTVSQSGGVPTGSIIERGSNANGEYVKFADGTLNCTNTLAEDTVACNCTTATGTLWYTSGGFYSWTHPIPFIDVRYYCSCEGAFKMAGVASVTIWGVVTNNASSRYYMATGSSATGYITLGRLFATGRWFI